MLNDIEQRARQLQIACHRPVASMLAGEYRSVFKGIGIEFDQIREYAPGDDVRLIDWNVSARYGEPFIKKFREERELTVLLAVDMSRSGWFGSGPRTKAQIAAELCGVLAFSAIANKDKVGLVLFSDRVEKFIPPDKGRNHVLRIIRELLTFEPEGRGTDLNQPLRLLGSVLKRKATIFLVSDFWAGDFSVSLSVVSRRHDMVAIRVRDPREFSLPAVGLVRWEDAESGRQVTIDASHPAVGDGLARAAARHDRALEKVLVTHGVDRIDIDATRSYVDPLRSFFLTREGRQRRRARR